MTINRSNILWRATARITISVALGFLLAIPVSADVRVWTDKETVILKGKLRGLEILPSRQGKQKSKKIKKISKRPNETGSRTLRVGPKHRYKAPSEAAREAKDGDTIEIAAGTYIDCAIWKASNITIRGVGGRAHIKDKMCQGKASWITQGRNITIENIEFSGMRVRDKNGAGIRHEGAGLTIRNAYFHDGEQGILGGGQKPGDKILIEDSEFARLGRAGRAHGIYIGGKVESLTVRRSFFHDCVDQGHCIKSRAKRTTITCNVIASLEGNSSYEIDLPQGGQAVVRNNVIEQGPKSVNRTIVAWAAEAKNPKRRNAVQSLVFEGNTVINDRGRGQFFLVRRFENTKLHIRGNKFIGPGRLEFEDGNERFPGRRQAGMKAYPALPAACKK